MSSPVLSEGFRLYWEFAAKRQQLYRAKLTGTKAGVDDPVLAAHRFTNPYRASDRVSQYLITNVLYDGEWGWMDTFVRALVFKLFNRVGTWEYLSATGEPDTPALLDRHIDRTLGEIAGRQPLYSGAYLMPPPRHSNAPKYVRHLDLLRLMIAEEAHEEIREADTMQAGFKVLRRYESIGDFLAYQFITDLNYSKHLNFSEDEFVVAGPGSARGLRKCFSDPGDFSDEDLFRWTLDRQHHEFESRGLDWHNLWGRDLQLIDIQNLYCETDKYARVAMPELSEHVSGSRIKQRYKPNLAALSSWFPPKWEINTRAAAWLNGSGTLASHPHQLDLR